MPVECTEEPDTMQLTRSLNLIMICAAFAFLAAMVTGYVP